MVIIMMRCFLRLKPHQSCSSQSEISNNQPQSHASQLRCIGTFQICISISFNSNIRAAIHQPPNAPVILFIFSRRRIKRTFDFRLGRKTQFLAFWQNLKITKNAVFQPNLHLVHLLSLSPKSIISTWMAPYA